MKSKEGKIVEVKPEEKSPTNHRSLGRSWREKKCGEDEPELPAGYRHLHESIDVLVQYL